MGDGVRIAAWGAFALAMAMAANWGADDAYRAHALILLALAGYMFIRAVRTAGAPRPAPETGYMDEVIRWGVLATAFWGVVGFLAGTYIAFQLAYPELNLGLPWTSFGRLRPLHTSAVIFAFGGNALIATSFYVVQRTCAARLWGGNTAWFVFWGYNLFIVLAATGYLLGNSQSKEYAEPEWYIDLWLTVVWVAYLAVFLGTIVKRKEPHIYVANWFYLGFIVTIAMLHVVNNLAVPVSIWGSQSIIVFPGVQGAMVQWWYGHNAVGFFLTAGFLGMMYYFIPKQADRPVYSYKLSIIHFWSLIFLYIWAGPHHLHYTALPDWAQILGMVMSVILWMPSLGRHDQRADDAAGRLGQAAHRPGAPDARRRRRLLRHGDLRGADDVDPLGQLAQPLHRVDDRPRPLRRARLERHDHLRRALLPGAEALEARGPLLGRPRLLALLARDHRHRALRRLDVGRRHHAGADVARGRLPGLPRQQLHRTRSPRCTRCTWSAPSAACSTSRAG